MAIPELPCPSSLGYLLWEYLLLGQYGLTTEAQLSRAHKRAQNVIIGIPTSKTVHVAWRDGV